MSRFSAELMEHFQAPCDKGRMTAPDVVGVAGIPGQGRFLVLYQRLQDGRIAHASFESNGCGVTIACGSVLTELVVGRTRAVSISCCCRFDRCARRHSPRQARSRRACDRRSWPVDASASAEPNCLVTPIVSAGVLLHFPLATKRSAMASGFVLCDCDACPSRPLPHYS